MTAGPTLRNLLSVSVLNPLAREVAAKIVFHGPGLSGKTTTLAHIHSMLAPARRGDIVSLATEGERTLFFDFLPVHIPRAEGLDIRLQLYTVPGQVFYGATRRLVLDGADGVVFVADSQEAAHERNLESLDDLESNLKSLGSSLSSMPHVIQYNKRDLPNLLSAEQLRGDLNRYGAADFETSASKGQGVDEVLRSIIRSVGQSLLDEKAKARSRAESGKRQVFDPSRLGSPSRPGERPDSAVSEAIASLVPQATESVRRPTLELLGPPALGDSVEWPRPAPPPDVATMRAPAVSPMSFAALWADSPQILSIEEDIAAGRFAEAVHRAASVISEILDNLNGVQQAEGPGMRAQ
ncbi:MAG TPA: GTPase domain-containing protein, partial [Polyangiaceae bacterium]|nr:GTPase domain-containing protein [Polyangiaceae bacterium]